MTEEEFRRVHSIYINLRNAFDQVLVGQKNVKDIATKALLVDQNTKILAIGNPGFGKTTLAKFWGSNFISERIQMSSDMLPIDIVEQLKNKTNLQFLLVDEFNRASGKAQSAFIELLEEHQISTPEKVYQFSNFYVFATCNNKETAGIFNIPQALYDRFDINLYFEPLSIEDKRIILFNDFTPASGVEIGPATLDFVKSMVEKFPVGRQDEDIMLQAISMIGAIKMGKKDLFASSNIRADKFILKLAKLTAMLNGRGYLLPSDIVDYINSVYMHRIDQNLVEIGEPRVINAFDEVKEQILSIKRKKENNVFINLKRGM